MDAPARTQIGRASAPPKSSLQRKSYAATTKPPQQGLDRKSYAASGLERKSYAPASLDRKSYAAPGLDRYSVESRGGGQQPALGRTSMAKTAQEMEARSQFVPKVVLSVLLLDATTGDPVVYKNDGNRFAHSTVTIKMAAGGVYNVGVSTKPEVAIEENSIFMTVSFDGNIRDRVIDLEGGTGDRFARGSWKCDFPPSKNGTRMKATLSGKLRDFGRFEVPLMLKVYNYNSKRLVQGTTLKQVGFDLKRIEPEKKAAYIQLGRMSYT